VPLTFVIFDLLHRDGVDLTTRPYVERRHELEALNLDGRAWTTCERFDDGARTIRCSVRARLEGGREEPLEPVPPERSRLGEDQEPELLAPRCRTRSYGAEARAASSQLRLTGALFLGCLVASPTQLAVRP
jgi:hypothetical protein